MRNVYPLLMAAFMSLSATSFSLADVVAPPTSTSTPGNAQGPAPFRFFGAGGSRVQQVFSSSFFGNSPLFINSISFRPFGTGSSGFFGDTISADDSLVRLSTTMNDDQPGTQLSTTFSDNVCADAQTVFSGPFSLTTSFVPGSGGTQQFDYTLNFTTPFLYDPSAGNLLLDVTIPSTATVSGSPGTFGFVTFDQVNTEGDGIASIVDINNGSGTNGQFSTAGVIASFGTSVVPEISSLTTLSAVIGGLMGWRTIRTRRSKS